MLNARFCASEVQVKATNLLRSPSSSTANHLMVHCSTSFLLAKHRECLWFLAIVRSNQNRKNMKKHTCSLTCTIQTYPKGPTFAITITCAPSFELRHHDVHAIFLTQEESLHHTIQVQHSAPNRCNVVKTC